MRLAILALAVSAIVPPIAGADEPDAVRPSYHFTPPKNWINDPNGCLFLDGEYHLFYQYNPEGDRWGHMSWGHAVSRDFVRWEHLPIALREESGVMIFSGSAVFDAKNTSGFGRPDAPPMVAIYTGHSAEKQTQDLASSLDHGRSWTKFPGNPVLDIGSKEFRDPKVFWHEPTARWIMATVLADKRKVRLWESTDLKKWTMLSDFGPAGSAKGVWECPDLLKLPVEGGKPGESRWVLKVDVNDGAPFGGSGGQYFVGNFDGKTFHPDIADPAAPPLWLDGGKDFYAAQSWNDAPGDQPVWIAWMNNWQYANDIPTSPWRGAMTVPRRVALRATPVGFRVVQSPVEGVKTLRREQHAIGPRPIPPGEVALDFGGTALEIIAEFDPGDAESFGLKVRKGQDEETVIGFKLRDGEVFVDRTHSGNVQFSPEFPGRHAAKLESKDGPLRLHLLIDATSVEVFADGGLAVITDQIFPDPASRGVSLYSEGGTARLRSLEAWELRP
jgi:fructan beta-fructosidase